MSDLEVEDWKARIARMEQQLFESRLGHRSGRRSGRRG